MPQYRSGGYDDGYQSSPCFWGTEPASLVKSFLQSNQVQNKTVLDAGCGEGKNSAALSKAGAKVVAIDCSPLAIKNAKRQWPNDKIEWLVADISTEQFETNFDIVVCYGLFHCLEDYKEISGLVRTLKSITSPGGYHIVCAFNSADQDLTAHPGFSPCLIEHEDYLQFYDDWTIKTESSSILYETHPHNNIPHHHSLSRIVARKQ